MNDPQRYFIWIGVDGKPITIAAPFTDVSELSAEQERPPTGAFGIRSGTKDELKSLYGLDDSDFMDDI